MNCFDFTNKVAVVFGAATGIGRETALGYGDCGATVAILAKTKEELHDLQREMDDKGYKAAGFECDVTDENSVKEVIGEIVEKFGKIDILFNNSGIVQQGSVEDLTEEDWNNSMNINARGAYVAMKYALPEMKKNSYGKVINTASVNAVVFNNSEKLVRHAYNVSKAAMVGLTKATAATYMKDGITINSVAPGLYEKNLLEGDEDLLDDKQVIKEYLDSNPANRLGKVEELVGTILYLSSDASNYVTGQMMLVDGGINLV